MRTNSGFGLVRYRRFGPSPSPFPGVLACLMVRWLTVARWAAICHGLRNHVIESLGMLEKMSDSVTTMVPLQVLADIDNSRNPMLLTKERLERAATENQFMNGKIHAIEVSALPSLLFAQIRCAPGNGWAVVGRRVWEPCG